MPFPIIRDVLSVDGAIEVIGNRRQLAPPDQHATLDAAIVVLGERMDAASIVSRWRESPATLVVALTARAWLIGDLNDLPSFG